MSKQNMTIILNEYCDKKKAHWVLENIDELCSTLSIKEEPKQICIKYCKEVINSQCGILKRVYQKNYKGRMFLKKGQNGFQNMKREFRSILASNDYYDLDIKNCQPTILLQYCKKNKIECKYLEKYVFCREELIEEMGLTKDKVKMEFIKVMYGGKFIYDDFKECSDKSKKFMNKFAKEIENILDKVTELNKDLLEWVKSNPTNKKYENDKGSVSALLCQEIEDNIIQTTTKFLKIKKFDIGSLCFDGLMVRNTLNLNSSLIRELNSYIKKKLDYEIEFLIKPFENYIDIPVEELNYNDEVIYIDDDKEGVDFLLKKLKDKIIKCKNRYFEKKDDTNIYIEDTTPKFEETRNNLFKFINEFEIKMNTSSGSKPYSKTTKGTMQLLTMLWANLPEDKEFIEKLWYSNLYKLCFLNGYYDYKKKEFKKYDKETFTTVFINANYEDLFTIKKEDSDYLQDVILDPIIFNKDQKKYLINWLSRGLAGHYEEKTWGVGLGNRDCGKGVITDLCLSSLGGYASDFTADQLIVSRSGNSDISKKMSWTIPFEFSRLNFSNELKKEDENEKLLKLDGDIIKKISSGGDGQKARILYKNEISFKIQGRILLFMNQLIPLTVSDAYQTSSIFNFQSIFRDKLTDEEIEINNMPNTECKFFLKDLNLKNKIKESKGLQLAFIKYLIDSYTSLPIEKPEIMNYNDDFQENENNDENKIKELFLITRIETDIISVKEVNEYIKYNTNVIKSKLKLVLQKLGVREKRTSKDRVYLGIKFKNIE